MHDFIEVLERCDRRDRAEWLVDHDPCIVRNIAKDGGCIEEAAPLKTRATVQQGGAPPGRIRDEVIDDAESPLERQGPHGGRGIESIADPDALCALHEAFDKSFVDALMYEEPRWRGTDLPGVPELRSDEHVQRLLEIRIFEDDDRRVPAKLHRAALERIGCELLQQLPDRRRACERNLLRNPRTNEMLGDRRGLAEHQVQ